MKLIDIKDFNVYRDTKGIYYTLNMQENVIIKTNNDKILCKIICDLYLF